MFRLLPLVLLVACASEGLPPTPPPVDGAAIFELGQMLFFERELSGNRNVACATCHVPFLSTTEPLALSIGQGGEGTGPTRARGEGSILPRHTSDLFHRGAARSLLWDGRVEMLDDGTIRAPVPLPPGITTALQAQALLPLLDRAEMRGHAGDVAVDGRANELAAIADGRPEAVWDAIVARLLALEGYQFRFQIAFPDQEITIVHVAQALDFFERSLWDPQRSRFDREGPDSFSEAEREGHDLFFGDAGCFRCHDAPLFTDELFHNLAVPQIGPGKRDGLDEGRALVTGDPADRFRFRTPSLRNVHLTAPYMHDGAFATLEGAIRHHLDPATSLREYDPEQLPSSLRAMRRDDVNGELLETLDDPRPFRALNDAEVDALVAFLHTLADEPELIKEPDHAVPVEVPSGLPVDHWPGGPHPSR
ncbi:MAG: hypothetical protein KC586_11250 [Myxococcales bacterium]|nr:hypothetical protein [Myxococcales bacterium]